MKQGILDRVRKIELAKDGPSLPKLNSHYLTTSYYDLSIAFKREAWKIELALEALEKPLEKTTLGLRSSNTLMNQESSLRS